MRAKRIMRAPVAAQMAAGALLLALPTAAAATVASDTGPFRATGTGVHSTHGHGPYAAAHHHHHHHHHHPRPRFAVHRRSAAVTVGQSIPVKGRLIHARRGQEVRLVTRQGDGWQTLARTRTGMRGHFMLRYHVPATGSRWLRVSTHGASAVVAEVTGLRYAVASWYYDAGNTACGFHAYYGVANKTLPCGTKVTLSYGGHTVVATVDDRGPYVAGRDYDLNQNTAAALGMYGVASVLAST